MTTALSESLHRSSISRKGRWPGVRLLRRLSSQPTVLVGASILAGLFAFILFGGNLFAHGECMNRDLKGEAYANCTDTERRLLPPSGEHLFGTDTIGRDILARAIYGGQITVAVGMGAAFVAVTAGTVVGVFSGFYSGLTDSTLMRFTEAMLSIPQPFLLLVAAKYLGDKVEVLRIGSRDFSGNVPVIILLDWLDELDDPSTSRAFNDVIPQRARFCHCRPVNRCERSAHYHASYIAKHGWTSRGRRHAGRCRRNSGRGLHQFSGSRRSRYG